MIPRVDPWLAIGAVLGGLTALMAAVKLAARARLLGPEAARKAVHVGMGLMCASFPWVFHDLWPVPLLAAGAVVALALVRWWAPVHQHLGGVLDGVQRVSLGEFYFPIAVAALRWLSGGRWELFTLPVLVLALADAVAALIGVRYGQSHYTTSEGYKSWEGSLAFFVTAFLAVHVPLLLGTDLGRAETLLIAATFGLLVMLMEAIAWRGLDNLFIPLGGYVLLRAWLDLDATAMGVRFGIALALVLLVMTCRWRTTLNDAALLGGALAGYASCVLGDWRWLLPPLVVFLTYARLSPPTEANSRRVHDINAVIAVTAPGFAWLIAAASFDRPDLLLPFAAAYAAQLACIGVARMAFDYPQRSRVVLIARATLLGWGLVMLPVVAAAGCSRAALVASAVALLGTLLAATAFDRFQPGIRDCPTDWRRWLRQAAICGAMSVLPLAVSR
ncbi:MAG: hypothetical protein H0W83_08735 [Planctomycetes bacterium]|nr:hypothetical protein [Planctomycetota bacterium]